MPPAAVRPPTATALLRTKARLVIPSSVLIRAPSERAAAASRSPFPRAGYALSHTARCASAQPGCARAPSAVRSARASIARMAPRAVVLAAYVVGVAWLGGL